jgi:hypothetical protein
MIEMEQKIGSRGGIYSDPKGNSGLCVELGAPLLSQQTSPAQQMDMMETQILADRQILL